MRTIDKKFFHVVAGPDGQIQDGQGAGADTSTGAVYAVGNLNTWRKFNAGGDSPNQSDVPPPSVGSLPGTPVGWFRTASEFPGPPAAAYTFPAANWSADLRVRRSGQVLEQDVLCRFTVIVYRMTNTEVFIEEVGRGTSAANVNVTTTTQTAVVTVAMPADIHFDASDRFYVDVYVQTQGGAPTVATEIWLVCEEALSTATGIDPPDMYVRFSRALGDVAFFSEALTRAYVGSRAVSDVALAQDAVSRVAGFSRGITDDALAQDALTRSQVLSRSLSDDAPATDAVTRQVTQARSISDDAPATDLVSRTFGGSRAVSDSAVAEDSLDRVVSFVRDVTDDAPADDVVERSLVVARALEDSAPVSETMNRVLNQVRFITEQLGPIIQPPKPLKVIIIDGRKVGIHLSGPLYKQVG